MFFNQAQLIGFVGNAPQVKDLPNGNKIAMFSVATEKKFKNKDGELITKTTWHPCTAYGKLAEKVVAPYVRKGSLVHIIGELETQEYTNSKGVQIQTYRINVEQIRMLPNGSKNGNGNTETIKDDVHVGGNNNNNNDDDIPF